MNSKGKQKNYNDDIYNIHLSDLYLYVNEFAELAKNNKEPMINKLFGECVYNIERFYLIQQDINNEKEKSKKLKEEMDNINDKKLYDELKKQYDNILKYIQQKGEFMAFTQLNISNPRYYNNDFNHFILKHKKLKNIMTSIKDAVKYE
jgi:dihydroorotate dehydrogenase